MKKQQFDRLVGWIDHINTRINEQAVKIRENDHNAASTAAFLGSRISELRDDLYAAAQGGQDRTRRLEAIEAIIVAAKPGLSKVWTGSIAEPDLVEVAERMLQHADERYAVGDPVEIPAVAALVSLAATARQMCAQNATANQLAQDSVRLQKETLEQAGVRFEASTPLEAVHPGVSWTDVAGTLAAAVVNWLDARETPQDPS